MAPALITLTTDFGLGDPYVGAVKGAILSVNPGATIVDISHEVQPQAIEQAAFVLGAAWPYFPAGTIHVAVVDPGVGTQRRGIALVTGEGIFVGPDNGVLSAALPEETRNAAAGGRQAVALPRGMTAYLLTNERFHRWPVSPTFHGRDIFAPAAAHLALGVPPEEMGLSVSAVTALPPLRAVREADGSLLGRVVHVDRFGNLVTDVRGEQLPAKLLLVEVRGRMIRGLSRTYGDRPGLLALIGSGGHLEVAVAGGSAARELGVGAGERVVVRAAG